MKGEDEQSLARKILALHSTSGPGHAPIDYELDRCAACLIAEAYLNLHSRSEALAKAARESLGLMCVNGKHANEGCKACAVAVALAAYEDKK